MKKTHIRPLYTCRVSFERKTEIWRLSFLMGRFLASPKMINGAGIDAVNDHDGMPTLRVYSGKWSEIAAMSHRWMMRNKV